MKYYFLLYADFVKAFRFVQGTYIFLRYLLFSKTEILIPGYPHKIFLRKNSSDLDVYRQIFLNGGYSTQYPDDPKVLIDAGANIGLFTIFMKMKFPDSKIICIEPDNSNYELLGRNTKLLSNVYLEKCGLWVRSSYLKITDKYDFGNWGMVTEETNVPGNLMGVSVNDIIKKHQIDSIDIFKIDIESSEKILFSENYQEWLPKVKMVIIELHDNLTMGCGQAFFNAIKSSFSNYSYFVVGDNTVIVNNDRN